MFTLILIGLSTYLLIIYLNNAYSYWSRKGIKTPKITPFLGTILEEMKYEPIEKEKRFQRELGKVFGTYFGTKPVLNTSKIEHIKEVLSDLKRFPNKSTFEFNDNYFVHGILFKSDINWKQQRSVQTHYFTSKKFRNLLSHIDKCASNLINNIESTKSKSKTNEINIKEISTFYGLDVILKVLYSIDVESFKEKDSKLVKCAFTIGEPNIRTAAMMTFLPKQICRLLGLSPFQTKGINQLGDYFKQLIKNRRKNTNTKYNDLSELLQDAATDGKIKITDDEIIGNMTIGLNAGVQFVTNAISFMLYFLAHYQNVQEKLREEIAKEFSEEIVYEKLMQNQYLDAIFQETMRLEGSFLILNRTCAIDTKLKDGFEIQKGTEIRLITTVNHLDPNFYIEPHLFNPDRWIPGNPNSVKEGYLYAPFGLYQKQCLGMRLALLNVKFAIVKIIQNYKVNIPDDKKIDKKYFRGFTTIRKLNIKLEKFI